MNEVAAILNAAITQRPHVLSLHAPNGEVCLVFASAENLTRSQVLHGWEQYFRGGYVAILWMNGEPVGSYTGL